MQNKLSRVFIFFGLLMLQACAGQSHLVQDELETVTKEHLKYLDYFDGPNFFWDTAGNTSVDTHGIKKILQRVPTYLFCRLSDKIKGVTQPFVFVGERYTN